MRTTTLSWLFDVDIIVTFRRRHYHDFSTSTLSWLFDVDIIMTFRRRHYHDFLTSTLSWLFDVDIIVTFRRRHYRDFLSLKAELSVIAISGSKSAIWVKPKKGSRKILGFSDKRKCRGSPIGTEYSWKLHNLVRKKTQLN
jgi:hypothetical protein